MAGLKSVVSGEVLRVRVRYQPATWISTRARFIINTNQPVVDRRIVNLECSADMVGNNAFFEALNAAINDDGVIHAVRDLLDGWGKSPWFRLRKKLKVRAVVLYWLGLTEARMAAGGPAEARDRAAFAAEFGSD